MNADSSPLSLGSAIEQAANSTPSGSSGSDAGRTAGPDVGRTAGPPATAPQVTKPAREVPGWAKRWKEPSRKALEALYQREDVLPHWDAIQSELDETYQYFGKQGQEYGEYKKRVDPIWSIAQKYEPQYRLQGMTLDQGLSQLFGVAEFLATDPDQALPWLGQSYKPKDAAAVVRALSQAWGVDLAQASADAPYVDPALTQIVTPLQQQLQAVQMQLAKREQMEQERQRHAAIDQISRFEDAKDASGNPLYPHVRRVFPLMAQAIQNGFAQDLASAYQFAIRNDPELAAELEQQRMEELRRKALEEAAARSQEAEAAKAASRNIGGKGKASEKPGKNNLSLSAAIKQAEAKLKR